MTNKLITLLEKNPGDWVFSEYTARHKPSRVELWISNGPSFVSVYSPHKLQIPYIHRFRLYRAVNKCKRKQIENLLS